MSSINQSVDILEKLCSLYKKATIAEWHEATKIYRTRGKVITIVNRNNYFLIKVFITNKQVNIYKYEYSIRDGLK